MDAGSAWMHVLMKQYLCTLTMSTYSGVTCAGEARFKNALKPVQDKR